MSPLAASVKLSGHAVAMLTLGLPQPALKFPMVYVPVPRPHWEQRVTAEIGSVFLPSSPMQSGHHSGKKAVSL